jgi:iron-sulfur cluster repair protein YtfE (RIC family)
MLSFSMARSMLLMAMAINREIDQGVDMARVEAALTRLSTEDSKLGERLINAAVAGAVVARQPADAILRAEAAEAWNSIKPVIAQHLSSEENIMLPWMRSRENFPPDLILRTCEQHHRLRALARTVDAASFIVGTDEEVTKAGTALTAFAVCLDDLIDGEERDLFPMIQRSLSGGPCSPSGA